MKNYLFIILVLISCACNRVHIKAEDLTSENVISEKFVVEDVKKSSAMEDTEKVVLLKQAFRLLVKKGRDDKVQIRLDQVEAALSSLMGADPFRAFKAEELAKLKPAPPVTKKSEAPSLEKLLHPKPEEKKPEEKKPEADPKVEGYAIVTIKKGEFTGSLFKFQAELTSTGARPTKMVLKAIKPDKGLGVEYQLEVGDPSLSIPKDSLSEKIESGFTLIVEVEFQGGYSSRSQPHVVK